MTPLAFRMRVAAVHAIKQLTIKVSLSFQIDKHLSRQLTTAPVTQQSSKSGAGWLGGQARGRGGHPVGLHLCPRLCPHRQRQADFAGQQLLHHALFQGAGLLQLLGQRLQLVIHIGQNSGDGGLFLIFDGN